jgi:hypothetical protein
MARLADAHNTRQEVRDKEWIAADMTIDPSGDFLTGMLGFSDPDHRRDFESDAWSWLKAERTTASGASEKAIVPFAVDPGKTGDGWRMPPRSASGLRPLPSDSVWR